ncbi:MAG TPA: TolC family protein, partial [Cytophagaceae bacterium]
QYFFDLLLAQVDFQIAETNLNNTSKILDIANLKFEMGKISKNEILQLQLERLKARKALGLARKEMQMSSFNLKSFVGLQGTETIELSIPPSFINMKVVREKVIAEAYQNRSDAIAFVRRMEESKRMTAQAKGDNGLNASLTARLGFSKGAAQVMQVYQNPQDQQLLQLAFEIPILDWGRQKARTKTALANQQFTEYSVEQDKQNFAQRIVTEVTLFEMMEDHVTLTSQADSIASEKYLIAKERYMLGNLSITDLSIAFREKDEAKRDYINALRSFWGSYYQIRYLSLYDFENDKKIVYNN